jgi:hypothetical protein
MTKISKYAARTSIICSKCHKTHDVTVGAIYKQRMRGNANYICKSCSGIAGWDDEAKAAASARTSKKWRDPKYAGTISGKAIARQIKKITGDLKLPQ